MLIHVRVVPNAKFVKVVEEPDPTEPARMRLKVYLTAVPEKGKANKALLDVLARHFGVAKSTVCILKGDTRRDKLIEIHK